ncbi:MAG: GatB/YqeY domain-containing protein [Chloroflexi bacterium]|nr:GatB/YqeY domain-containing protein [Chloroflexota bacterium]
METKSRLENALKDALRSKDEVSKRTIRMALASIKLAEIDNGGSLDETATLSIIQKEIKIRREAIDEAKIASRQDLIEDNEAEITVLESYLPQQLTPAELQSLVQSVVAEVGAVSPADMGKVMKALMPRVQGKAPGDQVSQVVRQMLQKS